MIHLLIIIVLYELLFVLVLVIFNLVPVTLDKIVYKISHSIILNLIYGEVIYIVLSLLPKKYFKVPLN